MWDDIKCTNVYVIRDRKERRQRERDRKNHLKEE